MGSLIYFTSNPSEYDDLEGLIISEQPPPGFIQGADRNVVAIAGGTLRGPVDTPVVVTDQKSFESVFGNRSRYGSTVLANETWLALANKKFGPRVVVCRAAAAAAAAATHNLLATATPIVTVTASSVGAWGLDITVDVVAATDANANHFDLLVHYRGDTTRYANIDVSATGNNNIALVIPNTYDVLVTVTKLADGRPDNVAGAALTGGSDGSIADADYTASGRAMDKINNYPGVSLCLVAARSTTAIKAQVLSIAPSTPDRSWVIWNGSHTADDAAADTDAALYRSDRIIYAWNSPTIFDPEVAQLTEVPPHAFMASIFSQTDVDQHVASKRTIAMLSSINSLHFAPNRGQLIGLKNAGVAALEQLPSGFKFRSGVTTSLTSGKTEIARRRQADFLQLSAADRLQDYVQETDTDDTSKAIIAELDAFSASYRDQQRIVADYAILGHATNAAGVKVIKWRVKLIGHILYLVLETEIGTGVTIEAQAA